MEQRILRLRDVLTVTGIGKSKLWQMIGAGEFPVPIRLGGDRSRAVGWHRHEVDEWIDTRPRIRPLNERSAEA